MKIDAARPRPAEPEITELLHSWAAGNRAAESELFAAVLPHLRDLARRLMRRERADHSWQPTELIHQAYFRLVKARERDWENRKHFYAIAARTMRRLLVDHARARPGVPVEHLEGLEGLLAGRDAQIEQAVAIDHLMDQLESVHPDWCSTVELKFYLGLTDEEAADTLNLPLRTVQRQYADARRWLFEQLHRDPNGA